MVLSSDRGLVPEKSKLPMDATLIAPLMESPSMVPENEASMLFPPTLIVTSNVSRLPSNTAFLI